MTKEPVLKIKVNSKIYSQEAVMSACYNLLDKIYVLLDKDENGNIEVNIWKKDENAKDKEIESRFFDELLNEALRIKIAKRNQKIREMIINKALYSAANEGGTVEVFQTADKEGEDVEEDIDLSEFDLSEEDLDFLDDPLGIAVPWEEKYGGKQKDQKDEESASEERQQSNDNETDRGNNE